MSILVIGANGGVGSKLVSQLNEEHVDFTAGVRKEDQVKELENDDKIDEIARMISGASVTELTRENAKEMIKQNHNI